MSLGPEARLLFVYQNNVGKSYPNSSKVIFLARKVSTASTNKKAGSRGPNELDVQLVISNDRHNKASQ